MSFSVDLSSSLLIPYYGCIFFLSTLPPLITVICLEIALPLFGSGPIYESMTGYMSDMCSNTFIYSICHVANFLHPFTRVNNYELHERDFDHIHRSHLF